MFAWMQAHSQLLALLWDGRNAKDERVDTAFTFEDYLKESEAVGSLCCFLEVFALAKGLPANFLILDYDSWQ